MGKLYCLMGKSASGKDTIYQKLREDLTLSLRSVVPYTTRPMRAGERDGVEYFFCAVERLREMEKNGKIIELRTYHTVQGDWHYFTADDGQIDLNAADYLYITTLVAYQSLRDYYGKDAVLPIYMEVDDGERLQRALNRERQQQNPQYEEMCRRFLADAEDFSEEKLRAAGIERRFRNEDPKDAAEAVRRYISER